MYSLIYTGEICYLIKGEPEYFQDDIEISNGAVISHSDGEISEYGAFAIASNDMPFQLIKQLTFKEIPSHISAITIRSPKAIFSIDDKIVPELRKDFGL